MTASPSDLQEAAAPPPSVLPREGPRHHRQTVEAAVFLSEVVGQQFLLPWAGLSFPLLLSAPPGTTMPSLPLSDRPGVVQRSVVDQLQERFALTLKAYIEYSRPSPAHR